MDGECQKMNNIYVIKIRIEDLVALLRQVTKGLQRTVPQLHHPGLSHELARHWSRSWIGRRGAIKNQLPNPGARGR